MDTKTHIRMHLVDAATVHQVEDPTLHQAVEYSLSYILSRLRI